MNHNHLVIMAGGKGSRFWPMSTEARPKQFIDMLGTGRSLLQMTLDRFGDICPIENVWVVTNKSYADIVREQLPMLPVGNILLEPCRRNTAPCIAYCSWKIKSIDPKANVVVSPSDHIVTDVTEFRRIIQMTLQFASETDSIVTLGMTPSRPETGYGYIQADMTAPSLREKELFRVDSFKEKPDLQTAKQYIEQKNFFWNAGIFVWNVSTIVNAFRIYQPTIGSVFEEMLPYFGSADEQRLIDERFPQCENISIDYAIMEKAEEIFVCPSSFGWSDLGTWGSLYQHTEHDLYGNVVIGDGVRMVESTNCIVHCTEQNKVVVQGLDGYIVVEKNGALLICKLGEEQRIRDFSQL